MKWLALLAAKMAHRSVLSTLEVASTEKLIAHYNRCLLSYRDMPDTPLPDRARDKTRWLIIETQQGVARELFKRGVVTPMSRVMGLSEEAKP
jgi:hypothetical protein